MKLKMFYLVVFVFFPCMAIADDSISTMASVLSELNHFPSEADKKALAGIIEDESSTADEKMLAQIISRIEHKASVFVKVRLEKILEREDTSQAARAIATAVVNINHKLKNDDIQAMKALIN